MAATRDVAMGLSNIKSNYAKGSNTDAPPHPAFGGSANVLSTVSVDICKPSPYRLEKGNVTMIESETRHAAGRSQAWIRTYCWWQMEVTAHLLGSHRQQPSTRHSRQRGPQQYGPPRHLAGLEIRLQNTGILV